MRQNVSNGMLLLVYSVVAYWAINFHIRIVQRYGSVVAVLVGNMRKAGLALLPHHLLTYHILPRTFPHSSLSALRALVP